MKEVNMRRLTSFTNILVLIFAAGLFIQACADKPDQGLKSQIDQLKKENAELKSKLAKIEEESAAKTKWDMHLNYPPGNFHSQGAQRFADRVKEATGGALEIVLHPGSALGFKDPELLHAVSEGQLDISEIPTGMVEGDTPLLALTA